MGGRLVTLYTHTYTYQYMNINRFYVEIRISHTVLYQASMVLNNLTNLTYCFFGKACVQREFNFIQFQQLEQPNRIKEPIKQLHKITNEQTNHHQQQQ